MTGWSGGPTGWILASRPNPCRRVFHAICSLVAFRVAYLSTAAAGASAEALVLRWAGKPAWHRPTMCTTGHTSAAACLRMPLLRISLQPNESQAIMHMHSCLLAWPTAAPTAEPEVLQRLLSLQQEAANLASIRSMWELAAVYGLMATFKPWLSLSQLYPLLRRHWSSHQGQVQRGER